ncbi:MAG: hypothetical protein LKJ13_01800 [Clostridia bacterium]|nr:hypothetical protein [Clostridia bacterium]MCI1999012.1 hypothetical protein [Clostridia bacterium]MCI2013762.1 hypothetical protein [Clostridia bacterium]
MSEVIDFNADDLKINVSAGRTQKFFDTARAVSKYLKGLSISAEENDRLVELMIQHTNAAEESGFNFGLKLATDILKSRLDQKEG